MVPVVVDTSVWRKYLAGANAVRLLGDLLDEDRVYLHPFVLGELTLGGLSRRETDLLRDLLPSPVVEHDDVLAFVLEHRLARKALGWVDVHLLASTLLSGGRLWSTDRSLTTAADTLGVAFELSE
jgi:predicted nucleic acid-binding protein